MKNLKKILIALAVVALLVSSFALIVGAEDEYTGDIKKLYNNYTASVSATKASEQADALAKAYAYLNGQTFDPDATYDVTEGTDTVTLTLADIVAKMSEKSVAVGELLYAEIEAAKNASQRLSTTVALLSHLASCPPTEGTAGAAELITKAAAKNSATVGEQYELVLNAKNLASAKKTMIEVCAHVALYPLDEIADATLIANIKACAYDIANQLYDEWNAIPADHVDAGDTPDGVCDYCKGAMDSATSTHYHNRYNGIYDAKYYIACVGFLVNNSIPSGLSNDEKTVAEKIVAGCAIMDAEMTAKQWALDAQASFDEYDFGAPYMIVDCESSLMTNHNATAESYAHAAVDIFGNKYHNFHYGTDGVHLYTEPQVGNKNAYQLGMVIEWDQLYDDSFSGSQFITREPSVGMAYVFSLKVSGGTITISNYDSYNPEVTTKAASVDGAVVPNVWAHFTLTYDDVTKTGKLYVNYEYVCDVEYSNVYKFIGLRMGQSKASQNDGYDNFSVMNGSMYRIWDKFDKMTDSQKFDYYVDYMVNEENPSLSRNAAYNKAKLLYATIKDKYATTCAESLAAYEACDYNEDIKKPAMVENLGILSEMVDELLAMKVSSVTTDKINAAIDEINTFVSVNGELINKGDTSEGGYQSLMMKVNAVKVDLVKIENVVAFVGALTKFERATTLTSMSKYAEAAQAIYVLAEYDVPDNVAFVENDPVVLSFEASINAKDILPEDEAYVTLFEYYEAVAEKIALRSLYENSKRIISCMDFVTSMRGYKATPEFWLANAEYIGKYVDIARDIVVSGSYDATVEGVDDAIATFRALDVCFYEVLQQQHIAFLDEQLAKYVATEVYIDKVGVCAVVAQYIAENDIAVYNTEMTDEVKAAVADEVAALEALLIKYKVYSEELEAQETDYEAVLAQNTQYFVNTINHMTTVLTYAELKPMFEKATGYYYSIDVDSEEAAAAADKYVAYREQLEAWETNGAIFVGFVDGLAAAKVLSGVEREDAVYKILVNCTAYVDLVDEGVTDVKNAMSAYDSALADYNAELEIVNSDISETAKITCAVRTGSISNVVLAIVSKIFAD